MHPNPHSNGYAWCSCEMSELCSQAALTPLEKLLKHEVREAAKKAKHRSRESKSDLRAQTAWQLGCLLSSVLDSIPVDELNAASLEDKAAVTPFLSQSREQHASTHRLCLSLLSLQSFKH